jgi:hypothetical protein
VGVKSKKEVSRMRSLSSFGGVLQYLGGRYRAHVVRMGSLESPSL